MPRTGVGVRALEARESVVAVAAFGLAPPALDDLEPVAPS